MTCDTCKHWHGGCTLSEALLDRRDEPLVGNPAACPYFQGVPTMHVNKSYLSDEEYLSLYHHLPAARAEALLDQEADRAERIYALISLLEEGQDALTAIQSGLQGLLS